MSKVPEGWEFYRLGDLGEIVTGNTPSTTVEDNYGNEYLFVSPFDMGTNKYVRHSQKMLSEKGFSQCRKIPAESVMVTCIASLGKLAIASQLCTTNQQINSIICNDDTFPDYVYYYLQNFPELIISISGTTAVPIVNKSLFSSIRIPIPPLPEQKRIAEILSSVDRSIEATEKLIAKLADVKKALMQELFTKGIGHTKFKDSPLGRIPEQWEVMKLGKYISLSSGKFNPTKNLSSLSSQMCPYPVYGGNGITGFYDKYLVDYDTIIIGRVGEYAGTSCLVSRLCWVTDNAIYVKTIDSNSVNLNFLNSYFVYYDLRQLAEQTGQPKITQEPIMELNIALPPISEQTEIASILSANDSKIEKAKTRLSKLQDMKKGLMQDLLTGTVRCFNA